MTVAPNSPLTRRVARNNIYGWGDDEGQAQDLEMLRQLYPGFDSGDGSSVDDPLENLDEGSDTDRGTPADAIMTLPYRQATAAASKPQPIPNAPPNVPPKIFLGQGGGGDTAGEYAQATREARAANPPPGSLPYGSSTGRGAGSAGLGGAYERGLDPNEPTGPLPTTTPPSPAARLQPPSPVDRAALYQQLRPYPGMSRSEKMQRMLSSAFHSASQPGTGNTFKDAARAYAHGVDTSLGISDYEKATRAQYAGQVIAQVAAGEEYWLKYYDKLTEGEKRGAEGQRALAYADYLRQRGAYYQKRGVNEGIDAQTKKILAEAARDRWHNVPEGGVAIRGKPGERPESYANPKAPVLSTPEAKLEAGKKLVAILNDLAGGQLTPSQQAAIHRAYNGANPPNVPAGSTMDKILRALADPDQARGDATIAEIKRAGAIVNSMRPPRQAGAGVAAANRLAAGHIGDIIQYNWHRYQNRTTGEVDWPRFISDANQGLLQRDVANAPGQRNVRDMDLGTALALIRDRQTPKGVPDTASRTGTTPPRPGAPATFTPQMQDTVNKLMGVTATPAANDEENEMSDEKALATVNEILEGNQ